MGKNDKREWNYVSVTTQLHKVQDKDIIEEAKRRKAERGTAVSKTLRNWVRIGFTFEDTFK